MDVNLLLQRHPTTVLVSVRLVELLLVLLLLLQQVGLLLLLLQQVGLLLLQRQRELPRLLGYT